MSSLPCSYPICSLSSFSGCLFGRLFISLLVFSAGSFLGLAAIQPVCKTFQRNLVDIDTTKYFHHTERFLWRSIKCKTTSSFYDNPLAALFLVVILEIPNIKWRENVLPTIQFNSVSIPFHSAHPRTSFFSSICRLSTCIVLHSYLHGLQLPRALLQQISTNRLLRLIV